MILEAVAIVAALATGGTCAAIDNGQDVAVWAGPSSPLTRTAYADRGEFLIYETAPKPRDIDGWLSLHYAEEKLADGPTGHRIAVACVDP